MYLGFQDRIIGQIFITVTYLFSTQCDFDDDEFHTKIRLGKVILKLVGLDRVEDFTPSLR